jgi:ribokinase
MSTIEIIGFGALNMDYLYQVKQIVLDGEVPIDHVTATPGGSAANTIYGLAKLGVRTGFVGAVGDDAQGKTCLKDLQSIGADTTHIRVKKAKKTGIALCVTDELGRRAIYLLPGANSVVNSQDIDANYLNQAKIVHFSSFVDEKQFIVQAELLEKLSGSVKISFAPGMLYAVRGMQALLPLLQKTDVLFINKDELEKLTGENFVAGAKECLKQGCQVVVVTLGKGLSLAPGQVMSGYICDKDHEYKVESSVAFAGQLDSTGAGDAFAAGFLFGLVKQRKLDECGQLGDMMAHFAMKEAGARQGLPTLHTLQEILPSITNS